MTAHPPPSSGPGPGARAPILRLPGTIRAAAGSVTLLPVEVTNTSDEPRQLSVLVIGVDQAWLRGPVLTRVLLPGESEKVQLPLEPAAGTLPAQYPVAVTVQALLPGTGRAAPGPSGVGETTLVVNPRAQLQVEVTPTQSRMVRGQRIKVVLRNGGSAGMAARLEGSATRGLEVRIRNRAVQLAPGEERRLRGKLVATRPRLFGAGVQHSWTVTAAAPDAVRRCRGTVQQRAILGPVWIKAAALVAVCAVWIAAAVVFIPQLAERFGSDDVVTATGAGDGGEGDDGDGGDGDDGDGGDKGGSDGGITVTEVRSPATPKGLQLNGTVTADDPSAVTVTLKKTSLVGEESEEAEPVGDTVQLSGTGKTPQMALVAAEPEAVPRTRTATTGDDGTWSFPKVAAPGYYLLTFSKLGYVTERYVVDAATAEASEPLEVELEPGDGELSGTVTGPGGRVGAATITITDGTSTFTTSTASRDGVGRWSVSGLATPASYLVQVDSFGLGAESQQVDLTAGDAGTLDFRLRPGVGALVGKVEGRVASRKFGGLGGVLVTVTDDDGAQRTATTVTTRALAGHFRLPGLPVPGTYTVTLSADGFQTQTSRVRFRAGQSLARLDAALVNSTGTVAGTVREKKTKARLGGAGLTLANDTHVYKATSTDGTGRDAGRFSFNGVEPGTYQLTTELFTYDSGVLTVTVGAGGLSTANPKIAKTRAGVLPATASIRGSAADHFSGDPLECAQPDPCQATVVGDDGQPLEYPDGSEVKVDFEGDEEYVIPAEGRPKLEPGLYTVRVSAPRYESAEVKVEVSLGAEAMAPTAELTRLPTAAGRLLVTAGAPEAGSRTCIWAVPAGDRKPTTDCRAAIDADTCVGPSDPLGELPPGPVCAWVEGLDRYLLELPAPGSYQLHAAMTDPAYHTVSDLPLNVSPGGTAVQNLVFVRKGEIQVVTHTLNTRGFPRPTAGIDVTIVRIVEGVEEPVPGHGTRTSGANGVVAFTGLDAGTYGVEASDPRGGRRMESARVTVRDNQVQTAHLTLGDRGALPFYARVATDGNKAVDDAVVEITAPDRYAGTAPHYETWSATTEVVPPGPGVPADDVDTDGCVVFLAAHHGEPVATTPCDDHFGAGSRVPAEFAASKAREIRVTAPGYDDLVLADEELRSVRTLYLDPSSVPFRSSLRSEAAGGVTPDYAAATLTVSSATTSVSTITVSADGNGALTWSDTRYDSGEIRPGTYTLTAQLDGYVSSPRTFTCRPLQRCTPVAPVLRQHGSLTVLAVDEVAGSKNPVNDVRVTLFQGGSRASGPTGSANDGNAVTFTGLQPGKAPTGYRTTYQVRVQAAGYDFDRTTHTLACRVDGSPAPSPFPSIVIEPGGHTICEVDLAQIGTVEGTVRGVLADPPAPPSTRELHGARVTATWCKRSRSAPDGTPYCTAVDTSRRFTTASLADGTFRITGTNTAEGLTDGKWVLRASLRGWSTTRPDGVPSRAEPGVVVTVGSGVVGQDVLLHVDPVDVTVVVQDQFSEPVSGLDVELMRGATSIDTATPVSGEPGHYQFLGAVPGVYTLLATGSSVLRTTQQLEIAVGDPVQVETMAINRAINSVIGTVRDAVSLAPVAEAEVTLHYCPSETTCETKVATGTDDRPLSDKSSGEGSFGIRTIPNGLYQLRVSQKGYQDAVAEPYMFDPTLGALPALDVRLAPIMRTVEVSVGSDPVGADLTGTEVLLASTDPSRPDVGPETIAGPGPARFAQVRYGCYDIEVDLPDGHYGDVKILAAGPPSDPPGCTGDVVVAEQDAAPITAGVVVEESEVSLRVDADPVNGHPSPDSAEVTVRRAGGGPVESRTVTVDSGTGPTVYLAPGDYVGVARPLGLPVEDRPFWPNAELDISVNPGAAPRSELLTLEEKLAEVTISTVRQGTGADESVTITLARGSTQSADVPAEYGPGVPSPGTVVLSLPSGTWEITVETADGRTLTREISIEQRAHSVTLELEEPPPPPPPDP